MKYKATEVQHELEFLAANRANGPVPVSRGERLMNDSQLLNYLQETLATLKSGRSHLAKRALEALIKDMQAQREAA